MNDGWNKIYTYLIAIFYRRRLRNFIITQTHKNNLGFNGVKGVTNSVREVTLCDTVVTLRRIRLWWFVVNLFTVSFPAYIAHPYQGA